MKKMARIVSTLSALALALVLAACSSSSAVYTQDLLEDAMGVKVTAENANDATAVTEGVLVVEEGDVIVISPFTEKGSFHVRITTSDGAKVAYDDDASGKVMFTVEAEPGTYDVETSGNKVTGWMTIFVESSDELEKQDAALDEALGELDTDAEGAGLTEGESSEE